MAELGQFDLLLLLIEGEIAAFRVFLIAALLELARHAIDDLVKVGILFHRTGDDQRRARLID